MTCCTYWDGVIHASVFWALAIALFIAGREFFSCGHGLSRRR